MMTLKRKCWLGVLAVLFAAFPLRVEIDRAGDVTLSLPAASAKSGSGSDGDGGDDGDDGDDGDGDDGDGDSDGDDDSDGNDHDDHDDDYGDDDDDYDDDDDRRGRGDGKPGAKQVTLTERVQNGVRVTFADGSTAAIIGDQFRRTDTSGRVVERRKAKGSDVSRMRAYVRSSASAPTSNPQKPTSRAVRAYYRGSNIEILYANGWKETVTRGQYVLKDQFDRIVASRKATPKDIKRLNRFRE